MLSGVPSTRRNAMLLVAVVAATVHARVLRGSFIWLDHAHLEDGLGLLGPRDGVLSAFTGGFAGTGFYRPFMTLSLSLDHAVSGQPLAYHLTTLAWHALASALVVLAAEALGLSVAEGCVAGLVVAVHPVASLVVSAIAFRSESMIAAALLGLIVAHVRGRPLLAALCLFVGALTKETALVLGPLFVAALAFRDRRDPPKGRLLAAEAVASAVALGLRLAYAPAFRANFPDLSPLDALGTRAASVAKSAARLLFGGPFDRTICDVFPVTSLASLQAFGGLVVLFAVAREARRELRGERPYGPAIFLGLSLLPSLVLVPVSRWWSPHYVYLPLVFGAMVFARLLGGEAARFARWVPAVLVVFVALSVVDDARFVSDTALFTAEARVHPGCREAHFYLAEVARAEKRWDDAALHYERSIATNPRELAYVDLHASEANLGAVELERGHPDRAATHYASALELTADAYERRRLTHDLATAKLMNGEAAEAASLLEAETARPDAFPESLLVRAKALLALGRGPEARALAERLRK